MRKLAGLVLVLTVLLLHIPVAHAQTQNWQSFDAYVNKILADWEVPGAAVAVVKDDKIIYAKGFGVKERISSPAETYRRLYYAVKSKNTEAIKRELSKQTHELAKYQAERTGQPIEKVYANGFLEPNFAATLPPVRDQRIKGGFGALEVYNEIDGKWENVPFIFEDGEWKLAVGNLFIGNLSNSTYESPGNSFSSLQRQRKDEIEKLKLKKEKINLEPLTEPKSIDFPLIDGHTLFGIASNSKAFTATAMAILVDEGKLNWDDKVIKYLPDFRLADEYMTREITIRDLLSHRSGLPAYGGDVIWWGGEYTRSEIVERVRFVQPKHSFRAAYSYQNIPFIIAGQIIEKVSGKSWDDFVKERILKPLKMNETTTSIREFSDKTNKTEPHFREIETGKVFPIKWRSMDNGAAAAGINSNVLEMANWLRMQLNEGEFEGKRIVSQKNIREIQSPQTIIPFTNPADQPKLNSNFRAYGLGWSLREYAGYKMVWHNGWTDGQLSLTAMIPEKKIGVVVLTNIHYGAAYQPIAYRALDMALGLSETDWNSYFLKFAKDQQSQVIAVERQLEVARKKETKPSFPLENYTGTYENELYGKISFGIQKGELFVKMSKSPTYVGYLRHWENDKFRVVWQDPVAEKTFLEFVVANGKVRSVKMAMTGFIDDAVYEYRKLPAQP